MKHILRLGMAAVLLALCSVQAHATVVRHLSLVDLISKAAKIVQVKVTEVEAAWDAENKGIWTTYSLDVLDTLKGDSAETLTCRMRGGVVGNRGQEVAGTPQLNEGREYVLFLWIDDEQRYQICGMGQGRFVVTREEGRNPSVANSVQSVLIVDKSGEKEARKPTAIIDTLDGLKTKIAKLTGQVAEGGDSSEDGNGEEE